MKCKEFNASSAICRACPYKTGVHGRGEPACISKPYLHTEFKVTCKGPIVPAKFIEAIKENQDEV